MFYIRVQSLEVQLSNMQVEVLALSRSQKELERFKKKLEISSKSVTHKVFFSMCPCSFTQRRSAAGIRESDRPEHQYTAHQELEKLRVKQEAMLLREKERQVGVYCQLENLL